MKKLPFLLLTACLLQGLAACGQHKYNPKAIKLNDSAVALVMKPPHPSKKVDSILMSKLNKPGTGQPGTYRMGPPIAVSDSMLHYDDTLYEKAIGLLDKAIQIDSNYSIAYFNKFNFQGRLKKYQDALSTGKELIRLYSNDGTITYVVGLACERTGDTLSAGKYYEKALAQHEKVLATMDTSDRRYSSIGSAKACDLFMLGRTEEAHNIWRELYNKANERKKFQYKGLWEWTRTDFLLGHHSEATVIVYPDKK